MQKAVFLDRDGVLNEEIGDYVYTPETFRILPGVPEALAQLKAAGYKLIIVTNQGGIGRGIYTRAQMEHLHSLLQTASGNIIDAIYYSPHHKTESRSLLSKPEPIMLLKGIARFNLDPAQCWLVGDAERDLLAARAAGVRALLLPTLKEQTSEHAHAVVKDLTAATEVILRG